MGNKLVPKTAKVLSETKKSKEKEAVAIAYEHIPRNPEEQSHGSLYAVVEIEDSSGNAEEIAEAIIDIFHKEYYEDPLKESLASFEAALAKINEELADRSGEGQINWLGKLNAILGVLCENTVHLTQAGKAEAYLYRGGHTMHITEDLAEDSLNPLRTFINVASGELTEKDKMVFVTPGIFYKISKNELKNFVTSNTPKIAVDNISKLLASENGGMLPNAVLILEMVSPESYLLEPEPEISTEAWIKEEGKPLEEISDKTLRGASKMFDILGRAAHGTSVYVTTSLVPSLKKGTAKISTGIRQFRKEKGSEKIILDSEERLANADDLEPRAETETINDAIFEPNQDNKFLDREIRIKEDKKPRLLPLERFNFPLLSGGKSRLKKITGIISLPQGKKSIIYLAAGLGLLTLLVVTLFINSSNKKALTEANNLYVQAEEKYDEAMAQINSGQRSAAIETLEIAEKLVGDIQKTNLKKNETEKLASQIRAAKNQALGVNEVKAEVFFDLDKGDLDGFYTDGVLFYAVNFQNGSVYSIDPKAKTMATIVENPSIPEKILFGTLVSSRKTLVLYTEAKEVYEIDLKSKKTTKQTINGDWEEAVAMASYNTNIYLLAPSQNQIYKHLKISGGYTRATDYVLDPQAADMGSSVDLAIDSNIYVTGKSGEVLKFTAGRRQNYNITDFPGNSPQIKKIYASANTNGIFLISDNRIFTFDEAGKYLSQIKAGDINNIKNIVVDDNSKTIFVLSKGKIFSVPF